MSPVRIRTSLDSSIPELPVLIVGAGPVGLVQAYFLSQLGVPSILLSRHTKRLGAPKAHALSPRSLEICRQFGISVRHIREHPASREDAKWVRFVTNLAGEEVGTLPYERMDVGVLQHTPEMLHNIAQPDFEAMVAGLIHGDPNIDFRQGWTWIASEELEDTVVSVIENTVTKEKQEVYSSILIACDGANSRVRKAMGIHSDSEDTAETMMTIHFSANLRPVIKERVGMLHWIMEPAARGFIIAYDLSGNQVLIHNFDPAVHTSESFTTEKCKAIIAAAIGDNTPFTFHSKLPWILRRQVATEFYRGRCILAGDAAHSFPPTGGLGLNSGIADAHNLACKIAAVYQGWANLPTILAAYHEERQPIAERNSQQSVTNGKAVFAMLKALKNTDPDHRIAKEQMLRALADPEQRRLIQSLIAGQREHFDNLMLHIGYVYEPNWDPPNASDFRPAFRRGARLSHAWISMRCTTREPVDLSYLRGEVDKDSLQRWRYSTLDLVPPTHYILITAAVPSRAQTALAEAIAARVPFDIVRHGVDFHFVDEAVGQQWLQEFGIDKRGAVLVRPDQHIGMILGEEPPNVDEVFRVLGAVI